MAGKRNTNQNFIYVVDDSKAYRVFLESVLRQNGYRVACFESPAEALSRIESDVPNLILSDIEMPHMDGFKFYLEVKMNPALSAVPFLFISSTECEKHHTTAKTLTHTHILSKPTPYRLLLDYVERFLCPRNLIHQRTHLA